MMQKNEDLLLPYWFRYHAHLFGAQNCIVFDNGSTNETCRATLREIERQGATVVYAFNDAAAFRRKGAILLERMHQLRRDSGNAVFFPLDCDEFVVVETPFGPSCRREAIRAEIDRIAEHDAASVSWQYLNHPIISRIFERRSVRKVFGTFRKVERLGMGYHWVDSQPARSAISYFHLHHRPWDDLVAKAQQKLAGHAEGRPGVSEEEASRRKLAGHKSAAEVAGSEKQYLTRLREFSWTLIPELDDWFEAEAGGVPFGRRPRQDEDRLLLQVQNSDFERERRVAMVQREPAAAPQL